MSRSTVSPVVAHESAATPVGFRLSGAVVLILGTLVFLSAVLHYSRWKNDQTNDFKAVYGSAGCLLSGCNPYSGEDLQRQFAARGGDISNPKLNGAFRPFYVGYPPSSLFWITPFALLPWRLALPAFISVASVLFIAANFLMADLCLAGSPLAVALIAVFLATSTAMLKTAQPAVPAIALCGIAVWCLLRNRYIPLGIVCFALSLAIKPHIGALLLAYFFAAGGAHRRRSVQIAATAILLCLPGLVWASLMPQSAHWPHDLSKNLAGIATRGYLSDPGPTNPTAYGLANLQAVVSVLRDDRQFYNHVTWLIAGCLLLVWIYVAFRSRPSLQKDLLGIASVSCISMLPIYHRSYDARILLLTFPAIALLLARGGAAKWTALVVGVTSIVVVHADLPLHLGVPQMTSGPLVTILLFRTLPLSVFAYSIFYLAFFVKTLRSDHPEASALSGSSEALRNRRPSPASAR